MSRSAVQLFKKTEEVKVPVHANHGRRIARDAGTGMGKDCIVAFGEHKRSSNAANTSSPVARDLGSKVRGLRVIGSSEQVHVVDALAITGDEGRCSLR